MKLDAVEFVLKEVAREVAKHAPATRWYIFGSVVSGKVLPGDIDLLVVYRHPSDPFIIRRALSEVMLSMPLHLLMMQEDEERELDGVATQKAVLIYPVLPLE